MTDEQTQAIEKLARWVIKIATQMVNRGPAARWELHVHAKGHKITASYTVYED